MVRDNNNNNNKTLEDLVCGRMDDLKRPGSCYIFKNDGFDQHRSGYTLGFATQSIW